MLYLVLIIVLYFIIGLWLSCLYCYVKLKRRTGSSRWLRVDDKDNAFLIVFLWPLLSVMAPVIYLVEFIAFHLSNSLERLYDKIEEKMNDEDHDNKIEQDLSDEY